MFKFNNTHIFTGYLKQLLSTVNIPTCRIYTKEYADYLIKNGKEDPRIIESFDSIKSTKAGQAQQIDRLATNVNYLKNNTLYTYFWPYSDTAQDLNHDKTYWKQTSNIFYDSTKSINGLTKTLKSLGPQYDTATHEYLGDYLRFLRDYYNVNLMSLYNCFNNKTCDNLDFKININSKESLIINSQDPNYRIYAFPVKLFANYTIAIDCHQGIELFCGLYNKSLDTSNRSKDLIIKTYKKLNKTLFRQPILYDKLNDRNWNLKKETASGTAKIPMLKSDVISRWDINNREQDLKLFIKVPTYCNSSIVVLEGDYTHHNNFKYAPSVSPCLIVDSCYVGENVVLTGNYNTAALRSYMPKRSNNCTESFTNCYSLAQMESDGAYGLVGTTRTANSTISNCFNAKGPIAFSNTPGLSYNVTNSYECWDTTLESTESNNQYYNANNVLNISNNECMKGINALDNMYALNSTDNYVASATNYPTLKVFEKSSDASTDTIDIWDGTLSKPEDQDGDGWCEITNGAELAYIIKNGGNAKYKLTNNIYLNDLTKINWQTGEVADGEVADLINPWYQYRANDTDKLPSFKGILDGNGYTVYGLYFKDDTTSTDDKAENSIGLIPVVASNNNVIIKNLGIDNAFLQSSSNTAALVGSVVYQPIDNKNTWQYKQNSCLINFEDESNLNKSSFNPVSKLQLLAFNTGESYPFSDRLVEYLSNSAITSIDAIPDNIRRVQKVMEQNKYFFKVNGLWENKMQKIIYDYIMNTGPIEPADDSLKLLDKRHGYHARLGHTTKSTLYDTLGYVDKEAEKWYTSWKLEDGKARSQKTIQNVDIYSGLYDI